MTPSPADRADRVSDERLAAIHEAGVAWCSEFDFDAICRELSEARRQIAASRQYEQANPLGGPASMFRVIAERIEAGEEYHSVLADYGLVHGAAALPVAWVDRGDLNDVAASGCVEATLYTCQQESVIEGEGVRLYDQVPLYATPPDAEADRRDAERFRYLLANAEDPAGRKMDEPFALLAATSDEDWQAEIIAAAIDAVSNSLRMDDPLFKDRTPIAAAHQLAVVLAYATECQLATLEQAYVRKGTSQSDKRRHQAIADTLVYHCRDLNVRPQELNGRPCRRLAKLLGKP